ncbi:hypothetical protein [Adhaeribacter soli]|uniref:Uncharacterized protein n=1 Tax=Adhaeribacter soli TaxID=2607655 RepID=A0A5N1IKQ0_9BACT|nr:hypothetical protein [Adhaeribacter soli]KAA9325244.1 hypothetical protein F0P94_18655 [Adhaeribacter soli]
MTLKNKGGLISLLVGFPFGLVALYAFLWILAMLTGGGLRLMGTLAVYLDSIIGLILALPIVLWVGGKIMVNDLLSLKSKWKIIWRYSLIINSTIWFVFLVIYLISKIHFGNLLVEIIPIVIFYFISIIVTLFTFSIMVYFLVKNKVNISR